MIYQSQRKLRYGKTNVVLDIEQDLVNYYRKLLPKSISNYLQRQMYDAHISVVRKEIVEPKMEFWGKYEGEIVDFIYSNEIRNSEVYYWIDIWSKRLEEIREELGLPNESLYIQPPVGLRKTFHATLGNKKHMCSTL